MWAREYILAFHLLSAVGFSFDASTEEPSPGDILVKVKKEAAERIQDALVSLGLRHGIHYI